MSRRNELVEELRSHLRTLTGVLVDPDEDFFARGLVDSLRSLEIVVHVEREYGLSVEVDDLELDNFRTVDRIADFVLRKQAEHAPADVEEAST
ncbi:phosphopantetheine-binding protein [Streptomyces albiaxialis]|uniref:Phosphopantetheine-binding protein n=1 Tax=Streptomyces albiaxialis TaxID=329523 RepID=A0ABP5ISX7_9ACTN